MIKNLGKDENGFQQYVWLTENQANTLVEKQHDPEQANKLVKVGSRFFRPMDILSMETVTLTEEIIKYNANFEGYVLTALLEEGKLPKQLQEASMESGYAKLVSKKLEELPEPTEPQKNARLEEMKKKLLENKTL